MAIQGEIDLVNEFVGEGEDRVVWEYDKIRFAPAQEKRARISRGLFYAGYGLWIIWKFTSITVLSFPEGSAVHTILHALVLLLLLISILANPPKMGVCALSGISLAVSLLVMKQSGQSILLDLTMILVSSTGCRYRTIARYTLILVGFLSVATVVASQLGFIVDYPFSRGGTIRHGLGFRYSTYLSHLYLNLVLVYLYLRKNHLAWWEYVLICVIDVYIFVMTDSRNSFGLVLFVLAASLAIRVWRGSKHVRRLVGWGAKSGFILVFAAGSLAAIAYDSASPVWKSMNSFTSNRLSQEHASLLKYGIKPFGQEIELVGNSLIMGDSLEINKEANQKADRNVIENSLIKVGVQYGAVPLVMVLAALFCAAIRASRSDDLIMSLTLLVFAAHSYFDPQLMDLLYTTIWFYAWAAVVQCVAPWLNNRVARVMVGFN